MHEQWKRIEGFPLYAVSSLGRVKNKRGKLLKPHILKNGYATVVLYADKKPQRQLIHRLVAMAFVGPEPRGHQVAHEDGDRLNNKSQNLSWKTPKQNGRDKVRHGTSAKREQHGRAVLTESDVKNIRFFKGRLRTKRRPWGAITIARELDLPVHAVSHVLGGRTWKEVAA